MVVKGPGGPRVPLTNLSDITQLDPKALEELKKQAEMALQGSDLDGIDHSDQAELMKALQLINPQMAGLEKGHGPAWPPGTVKTEGGFAVVPHQDGAGFDVYDKGAMPNGKPIYQTKEDGKLYDAAGKFVNSWGASGMLQLGDGTRIYAKSNNAQNRMLGDITFENAHGEKFQSWEIRKDYVNSINKDKTHLDQLKQNIKPKQDAVDAQFAQKQNTAKVTGGATIATIIATILAPFTGGLSLIGTAVAGATAAGGAIADKVSGNKLDQLRAALKTAQDELDKAQGQFDHDKLGAYSFQNADAIAAQMVADKKSKEEQDKQDAAAAAKGGDAGAPTAGDDKAEDHSKDFDAPQLKEKLNNDQARAKQKAGDSGER